jgi:hypothetical protein
MSIALIQIRDPESGKRTGSGYYFEFSDHKHFERAREIAKSCSKPRESDDSDEYITARVRRQLEAAGYKVHRYQEVISVDEYELPAQRES